MIIIELSTNYSEKNKVLISIIDYFYDFNIGETSSI